MLTHFITRPFQPFIPTFPLISLITVEVFSLKIHSTYFKLLLNQLSYLVLLQIHFYSFSYAMHSSHFIYSLLFQLLPIILLIIFLFLLHPFKLPQFKDPFYHCHLLSNQNKSFHKLFTFLISFNLNPRSQPFKSISIRDQNVKYIS